MLDPPLHRSSPEAQCRARLSAVLGSLKKSARYGTGLFRVGGRAASEGGGARRLSLAVPRPSAGCRLRARRAIAEGDFAGPEAQPQRGFAARGASAGGGGPQRLS